MAEFPMPAKLGCRSAACAGGSEAAFQNDRHADLAVVANMIVTNDSEERIYRSISANRRMSTREPDSIARAHVLRHGFLDAGIAG